MFKSLIILTLFLCIKSLSCLEFKYHTHEELIQFMKNFTQHYNGSAGLSIRYYTIGKSWKKRDLAVIEITAVKEKTLVPNVKLIGNIHGNEPVGREVLLHYLEFLVQTYNKSPKVTWLLRNTILHILPALNPDGFAVSEEGECTGDQGRGNSNRIDLNRNFPDYYKRSSKQQPQPEMTAIKKWMNNITFILSGSLHGGALVANYPFDTVKEFTSLATYPPSVSPDEDVFKSLSSAYADKHSEMYLGRNCGNSTVFIGGITNGAAWYPFRGGMQDYNYFAHGCMELTLEISCCKYPKAKELPMLWKANKNALLNFCMEAHQGVKGTIKDSASKIPINSATLKILDRDIEFKTNSNGEFWRLLLPGRYKLKIRAEGYHEIYKEFQVFNTTFYHYNTTILTILLSNKTLPSGTLTTTAVSKTLKFDNNSTSTPKVNQTETDEAFLIRTSESTSNASSKRFQTSLFYLLLLCYLCSCFH